MKLLRDNLRLALQRELDREDRIKRDYGLEQESCYHATLREAIAAIDRGERIEITYDAKGR